MRPSPSILMVAAMFSGGLVSCQTAKTYAPEARPAVVDSVEVKSGEFEGRPEAVAVVSGIYSSSAAQLVDSKQSRDGNMLYLEVREQTPRDAIISPTSTGSPSFETKIPIELLGLEPGEYIVSVNGVEAPLTVPAIQAEPFSGREVRASRERPPVQIVDEFIAIEDTGIVSGASAGDGEASL